LGKTKEKRVVQPLIEVLKDENENVRRSSVLALLSIKSEIAVDPLIKMLNDKDFDVRLYALEALKTIGTPEALKAVKEYKK
jgi:HEAT repeat protein